MIALAGLALIFVQKITIMRTKQMNEGILEMYHRHHRQFMCDMHFYQMVMISGAWLSLNFILRVSRDKDEKKKFIVDYNAGVKEVLSAPKKENEKKND